ncbi:MAG: DUF6519 domain-containing protein [Sphingomonas sp.]
MKGDFSRDTYHAGSHYSRVMMQQGRVQLDSDWNEQTAILLGYMRALTRDVFGPAAGPAAECGFQIVTSESRDSLSKEVAAQVDAFLKSEKGDLGDDDMLILPGRYYVGGLPVEAGDPIRYRAQSGFPFGEAPVDSLRQRNWLAYLDVWEEYVSADQDPAIRDVALGGIDTCGRARIRWQVRLLLDIKDRSEFDALTATGTGRLRARANPTEDADELCSITPDARYRGAENQLYRVEIQTGGKAEEKGSGATFKWSRDNAAITFPILSSTGNRLSLAHLGRDEASTLIEGDWVELVDDATGSAGLLAQVSKVERDDLRVELSLADGAPNLPAYASADAAAGHALLRRWDHAGDPKKAGGALPIIEGAEIELEDGIKVTFETGGNYRAGEYWMIPARVATGDVEWPGAPDNPQFQLPQGPRHYYAPLAMRSLLATGAPDFADLRCRIARLPCVTDKTRPLPDKRADAPVSGKELTTPDKDAVVAAGAGTTKPK